MKTMLMIALAATGLLAATQSGTAAARYEGPWCAHISNGEDSYNERCDLRTYEECRTEIFNQGPSYCSQNPYYRGEATSGPRSRKTKVQRQ